MLASSQALAFNLDHTTFDPASLPPSIRFTDGERRVFQVRERDPHTGRLLTVSEYTERYRDMAGDSKIKGKWRNINAPYAVLPMDLWTHPTVREIYLCFAPQTVKSQIAFNCIHYSIPNAPGAMMYTMATEDKAKGIMKKRLRPMFLTSEKTAPLISPYDTDNTQTYQRFLNGASITMAWATSVNEISSDPIRYYIGDEVSKWPGYAMAMKKKEASPIDLLRVRANSYADISKGLFLSSPGEDPCAITDLQRYDADVAMRFRVPCPVCGHEQFLVSDNIVILHNVSDFRRVARDNLSRYACDKCGMYWDDYLRVSAIRRGRWVPGYFNEDGDWLEFDHDIVNPTAVAFHLPSWYNVNMPLSHRNGPAVAKMRQDESPEKKQVFVTQHKAECYKEVIETKKESKILEEHRTALPSQIVPKDALALVAGFDSHTWGYRFTVFAIIPDKIGYTVRKIHHGQLGTLEAVEELIYHGRYNIEGSSETMGIFKACIDVGGNRPGAGETDQEKTMTELIYDWLRKQQYTGVILGVKGASQRVEKGTKHTRIDYYPHSNKPIPGGLEIYFIDTYTYKGRFHWRLTRGPEETQRFLMDADTDNDYVRELLAEELKKKHGKMQWVKVRSANHYLDIVVYCLAMLDGPWLPLLRMYAAMRQHHANSRPQVSQSDARTETQAIPSGISRRPDMDSIRERLADRFNR